MIYYFTGFIDNILYSPLGLTIQVFLGVASIFLFGFWVWLHTQVGDWKRTVREWKTSRKELPAPRAGDFQKRWDQIAQRISADDESQWKLGILEADAMMDTIIKEMGFKGETMGDRMKSIRRGQFPFLDEAWQAHKVRNYIAHNSEYKLPRQTANTVFSIYERIFRELKVLS